VRGVRGGLFFGFAENERGSFLQKMLTGGMNG